MIKKITTLVLSIVAFTMFAQKTTEMKQIHPTIPSASAVNGDSLWIASNNSEELELWSIKNNKKLASYTLPDYLYINCIRIENGNLWLGTDGDGVYIFQNNSFSKINYNVVSDFVNDIYITSDTIWFATYKGLGICYKNGNSYTVEKYNTPEEYYLSSVTFDGNGDLWLGTNSSADTGLYHRVNSKWDGINSTFDIDVYSLSKNNDGNILAATENGIGFFENNNFIFLNSNDGLSDNRVTNICVDNQDRIWVGYYFTRGIDIIENNLQIKHVNSLADDNDLKNIVFDGSNMIITTSSGVDIFNMNLIQKDFCAGYPDYNIYSLSTTKSGEISFICNSVDFIYTRDLNGKWSKQLVSLNGQPVDINSITFDKNDNLWVITDGDGALKFENNTWTQLSSATIPGFIDDNYYVSFDNNNNPWFYGGYDGIQGYVNDNLIILDENNGLTDNEIEKVFFDNNNNLWIQYFYYWDLGASVWNGTSVTNYPSGNISGYDYTYSVSVCPNDTTYISTDKGIYKISNNTSTLLNLNNKIGEDPRITRVFVDNRNYQYFSSNYTYTTIYKYNTPQEQILPYCMAQLCTSSNGTIWYNKIDEGYEKKFDEYYQEWVEYYFDISRGLWCIYDALNVDYSVSNDSICAGTEVVFTNTTTDNLSSFAWDVNNDGTIEGTQSTFNYTFTNPGSYRVKLTASNGIDTNYVIKTIVVDYAAYPAQIGLVTASENDDCLIVAWEKEKNKDIQKYNIYSLGSNSTYQLLGSVDFNGVSTYKDITSDYKKTAYSYKITTVNSCDMESDIDDCTPHKSIHLVKTVLDGNYSLNWNLYEGATPVSYIIYEITSNNVTKEIDNVPNVNTSYTITNYEKTSSYRVGALFNFSVNVSVDYFKTDSGPFSQSLSNLSEANLTNLDEAIENNIVVFPSPAKEKVTVDFGAVTGITQIQLTSISGNIIEENGATSNSTSTTFDVSSLNSGIYVIRVKAGDKIITKEFIKQ